MTLHTAVTPWDSWLIQQLYERLAAGCTNQSRLWREIHAQEFTGTRSLVATWIHAHGHDIPVVSRTPASTLPGPTQLAWLVLHADDEEALSTDDRVLWERLRRHEELVWVQDMARRFAALVRERRVDDLPRGWRSAALDLPLRCGTSRPVWSRRATPYGRR